MYYLAIVRSYHRRAFLVAFALIGLLPAFGAVTPTQLVCEYQTNPLGIDVAQPRLSWQFAADAGTPRGWTQTGYQIQAATSAANLANGVADLWDSGRVLSAQNAFISYAGTALTTSEQVFWRVRSWDNNGTASAWSATASWTMGLLASSDWKGSWIMMPTVNGATYPYTASSITGTTSVPQSVMARKDFTVNAGLTRATLTICGLGCYEFSINGAKVGQSLFPPGWTNYAKTCLYDTYDVTSMLTTGNNAAGFVLANGMYNEQGGRYTRFTTTAFGEKKAIGQLRLQYSNGSVVFVPTDATWKITSGPLTFSSMYGGEDEDLRLEPSGWNQAGFNASAWKTPLVTTGPTGGVLTGLSCAAPPVQAFGVFSPVKSTTVGTGIVVYDLGQNASFMPKITVHGAVGSYVVITPAELINSNGTLNLTDGTPSYWRYTLSGAANGETWMPRFTYRGCRYLQVQGFVAPGGGAVPVVDSIVGVNVHSASTAVGTFSCSNSLFNSIHSLIRWAQSNNMETILTDCPQREKFGWLEQDHLNGPSLRYEFDLGQLYTKIINDISENQQASGLVPTVAPEYATEQAGSDFETSPEWGSTFILAAWQQYQFDGDVGLLARNYSAMKKLIAYMGTQASGNILSYGLGDWYDLGPGGPGYEQLTPIGVTATAHYYLDTQALAQIAQVLGNSADAATYQQLATNIQNAFNAKFYSSSTGSYSNLAPSPTNPLLGSQTENSMPLAINIVPSANIPSVLNAITQDISNHNNSFTCGEIGYRYLLRALTDNGRADVVFSMNNQSVTPGYGYMIAHGATSLTEAWNADPSSSQSHFMSGEINEWFYHDLAGIQSDLSGPGFKKIVIKPSMVGDITATNASYNSINGTIVSNWTNGPAGLTMNVTIPPGTTATIYVPATDPNLVQESGGPAASASGVQYLGMANGAAMYAVGSGSYSFSSITALLAPTRVAASGGNRQVVLSWTSSANATSYMIQRAFSGSGYTTIASNVTATTYTDTGVSNGLAYSYIVSSVNGNNTNSSAAVTATPTAIGDGGFESPSVSGYSYGTTGSSWTFSAQSGNNGSGIAANGSNFTSSNSSAPEGTQVAFLQGTGSSISQVLVGLIPGEKYAITFSAAQRSGININGQTWKVTLDGTAIGSYAPPESATTYTDYTASFTATATSQTLAFVGTDTGGGDNTVFIDNVRFTQPMLDQDTGFELPALSVGYSYGTIGSPWTFSAQSGNNGSGITGNGSGFTSNNSNAPEGVQVAFLQGTGVFSQVLSSLVPGASYTVTFSAAQRANTNINGQTWQVKLDGTTVGTYAPAQSATTYTDYTANFTATATSQTLSFVGTDTRGGDNTVLIDNVRIPLLRAPVFSNGPPSLTAVVNAPYNFAYQALGNPAPTFALASGNLPPGLTLTSGGVLSGIPTVIGNYTGTISANNGVGSIATQNFNITIVTAFTQWESLYFNAQQMANPAISGANATPQNDGISNLLKYLFNIDPTIAMSASSHAALPAAGMTTVGGVSYLTLTYRQNASESGLTINVQTSSDLQSWQTVTPDITRQLGVDPVTQDPIIQVEVNIAGAARKFIRLNVVGS